MKFILRLQSPWKGCFCLCPVINVPGEQIARHFVENTRKVATSSTNLSGSKYFPCIFVQEGAADPWRPGVGSQDLWKSSIQAPSAPFVASPTVAYQIDPVSAQLEAQHRTYLATRIDLTQLFKSDNGSREVSPPTDDARQKAKPMETAEFVIGTPVQSRSPGWRRRNVTSDSLSIPHRPSAARGRPRLTQRRRPSAPQAQSIYTMFRMFSINCSDSQDAVISEDIANVFDEVGTSDNMCRHGGCFFGETS